MLVKVRGRVLPAMFSPSVRAVARDDAGAALVAVMVVMFVGVIAAVVIAGSVIFAMRTNVENKSDTQAFVSAESGRDMMLQAVMANPCTKSIAASTTSPLYENVSAQFGTDFDHLTDACLSTAASSVIRITATGKGGDGSTTTIVSDYQRAVTYEKQPGGTLAYFAGQFKLTQSTYAGDLVIRTGDYNCNSTTSIDGDLWAPKGSIELSADCHITGSVYANGTITTKGSKALVDKNVVANGEIILESTNGAVGGNVMSGTKVTVKDMTVAGNVQSPIAPDVKTSGLVAGTVTTAPLPGDAFVPTLQAVYDMTTWVDFPSTRSAWGTDVDWRTPSSCTSNITATVAAALAAGTTRVGIDYTACTTAVKIILTASPTITKDVLFLVPPGVKMNVDIQGLTTDSVDRQLFFIHADNVANRAVTCPASVGSGGDEMTQLASGAAKVMLYTPCGITKAPKKEGFRGQYYSGDSGSIKLEQPDFDCQPMTWTPRIDLGCKLAEAPDGSGEIITKLLPPTMLTQTE
ncbi:hypothetical protein ACEYYH_08565 [Microbacterium trichothecenolyticum]|uniref:hypothetical protein n=1 Tax=Microbacterium trichothecenolyticum TaxID=69370 RepID=UPI0035BE3B8B